MHTHTYTTQPHICSHFGSKCAASHCSCAPPNSSSMALVPASSGQPAAQAASGAAKGRTRGPGSKKVGEVFAKITDQLCEKDMRDQVDFISQQCMSDGELLKTVRAV
eukprot:11186885-Lingulodinium_polyedra.AAC.1